MNLLKGLSAFGNYTYIHAQYDENDEDGNEQEYADNQFRLTPEHTLNLSLKLNVPISSNFEFFAIPSISYKSKYYFEDANTEALSQDAYALVNVFHRT